MCLPWLVVAFTPVIRGSVESCFVCVCVVIIKLLVIFIFLKVWIIDRKLFFLFFLFAFIQSTLAKFMDQRVKEEDWVLSDKCTTDSHSVHELNINMNINININIKTTTRRIINLIPLSHVTSFMSVIP